MNIGHYRGFEIEDMYFFLPEINCSVPITSMYFYLAYLVAVAL